MKKPGKHTHLTVSIICFAAATALAIVYAVWENKEVRFLSAVGFAACGVICFKMFLEYLKDIGFGRKLFGNLRKMISKLCSGISRKLKSMVRDEDKLYVTGKKNEFQMKLELFRSHEKKRESKPRAKLPKYSSVKEDKQKVRYIYTAFLQSRTDKGYSLDPSRTPTEIGTDFSANEKASELFACYPAARYSDDRETVDKKALENIEELLK